ncbi:hypothetical protein L1F30_09920 [Simiduia sp. 21SJ11W-1]|uniref:hypothetical protein n=1 Tax=Simiduia sp. 21SJ11W-1 TaxID=2909669 RepID=UPI00209F1DF1|nr:hypothetical protein [Simiduia sp. 21SJ11W-1]UTA46491.1 hypothetical protein L1F30_09920 [Simiduia sp. 21SJ11W-1]
MKNSMKWLLCAGLLALSTQALADHRRHDSSVSISLHSPTLGVHYTDRDYRNHGSYSRYGHRHGHGCGHYWDGRVWAKPVPYYRDYGYYGHQKYHWKNHYWKKHWRKHHKRHHRHGHRDEHRGDWHDRRGDDRHDHRDRRRDDRHDRRDRRDDRDHRRRHD